MFWKKGQCFNEGVVDEEELNKIFARSKKYREMPTIVFNGRVIKFQGKFGGRYQNQDAWNNPNVSTIFYE